MFNVKFSKLGWEVATNPFLSRVISKKINKLTDEEILRGYFEIPLQDGRILKIVTGPDLRNGMLPAVEK